MDGFHISYFIDDKEEAVHLQYMKQHVQRDRRPAQLHATQRNALLSAFSYSQH